MSAEQRPKLAQTNSDRVLQQRRFIRSALLCIASAFLAACSGAVQSGRTPTASPSTSASRTAAISWPWTVTVPAVDSVRTEVLAPAIRLHRLYRTDAPLRAYALDIDLEGCVSLRAMKGFPTAVGRLTTSALLQRLAAADGPVAGVNADFFSYEPSGVPTGAHVQEGRVLAGPGTRPVFGLDSGGKLFISALQTSGTITTSRAQLNVNSWNRTVADGISVLDQYWGQPADSNVAGARWTLEPIPGPIARRYHVQAANRDQVARGDTLLVVASSGLRSGDTVQVRLQLAPHQPVEAVGGFPLLVRDSNIVVDSTNSGAAGFRGLNPRTAVGFGANGRRLLLVVADGRQPGVSVGLTIDETAQLLRQLGATDALNLDGGGSSALVLAARVGRRDESRNTPLPATRSDLPWLVNRPSDGTGERPVANALAVLSACER